MQEMAPAVDKLVQGTTETESERTDVIGPSAGWNCALVAALPEDDDWSEEQEGGCEVFNDSAEPFDYYYLRDSTSSEQQVQHGYSGEISQNVSALTMSVNGFEEERTEELAQSDVESRTYDAADGNPSWEDIFLNDLSMVQPGATISQTEMMDARAQLQDVIVKMNIWLQERPDQGILHGNSSHYAHPHYYEETEQGQAEFQRYSIDDSSTYHFSNGASEGNFSFHQNATDGDGYSSVLLGPPIMNELTSHDGDMNPVLSPEYHVYESIDQSTTQSEEVSISPAAEFIQTFKQRGPAHHGYVNQLGTDGTMSVDTFYLLHPKASDVFGAQHTFTGLRNERMKQ